MLTPQQIALRAARELREGDSVYLDEGLARLIAGCLPSGAKLVGAADAEAAVDVAVLMAVQVANDGEFVGTPFTRGAKRVIALLEHHQADDGSPRLLKHCQPATGRANLVITDLAVFDVTPEGLILREVAPGVSALDVQLKSDTPLLASDDLKVIDA